MIRRPTAVPLRLRAHRSPVGLQFGTVNPIPSLPSAAATLLSVGSVRRRTATTRTGSGSGPTWRRTCCASRGKLHPGRAGPEIARLLVARVDGGRRVGELVDDDEAGVGLVRQDDLVDRPRRVAEPPRFRRPVRPGRVAELDRDRRQGRDDRAAGLGGRRRSPSPAGPTLGGTTDGGLPFAPIPQPATSTRRDDGEPERRRRPTGAARLIRAASRTPGRPSGGNGGGRPSGRPSVRRCSRSGSRPPAMPASGRSRRSRRTSGRAAGRPRSVRSAADGMCDLRDDEDVGRAARGDVVEREDELVVGDGPRGQLAADDPAEQAVGLGSRSAGMVELGADASVATASTRRPGRQRQDAADDAIASVGVDRVDRDPADDVLEVGCRLPGAGRGRDERVVRGVADPAPVVEPRLEQDVGRCADARRGPARARARRRPPGARPRGASSSRSSTWPAIRVAAVPGRAE